MRKSKSYYFTPTKILRDLVHEYVHLSRFQLKLIDTIPFQRLKDVRQLSCQHVYPAARHTRFEHSLGVMELTRQAIQHLNRNRILGIDSKDEAPLINENLEFNALLAAILHDVGHCPFSHLGEIEFDSEEVREYLYDTLKSITDICVSSELLDKLGKKGAKEIGAVHEQLSCIVILEKYYVMLSSLSEEASNDKDECDIETDFELIIRSILGIQYNVSSMDSFENNKAKNVIVRLIYSSTFDMDKLDYIMRDSFYTGLGTPVIDTKRLFGNMYFNNQLSLVFTSRAVPALQNMIDSRDALYMYVYNHHAVVFSDFMNTYILRRLSRNADEFLTLVYPNMSDEDLKDERYCFQISALGLVPKPYLFSTEAIVEGNRSDSDWLSLLNVIHSHYNDSLDSIQKMIRGEIHKLIGNAFQISKDDEERLSQRILKALELVHLFKTRCFLKPWWKTVYEFSNFMSLNFRDDTIRKQVGEFICGGDKVSLDSAELRSQIAKHVIFITKELFNRKDVSLLMPLEDGDFFVVQRSTRFFSLDTIEKLEICLKSSEIIGPPNQEKCPIQDYYIKSLTKIFPQKDYSSIYAKEGFYIFIKPALHEKNEKKRKKHYKMIQQIFVFVATEFARRGEQAFIEKFQHTKKTHTSIISFKRKLEEAEQQSMNELFSLFWAQNCN